MKKPLIYLRGLMLALLLVSLSLGGTVNALAQGTVSGNKTLSATDIACDGATEVTLTLTGQTGLAGDPEDIVLVLDRSGSMGAALPTLKSAANSFVDIIDQATDGALDGVISNGSRVGVVSFAGNASLDQALTTNANAVKAAVNALAAGGATNHEAAIQAAQAELAGSLPGNTKDMIIFTDGQTTAGGNPNDDAAAARAAGTEIFAIGLGNVNVVSLNNWATDPDSDHVFVAPSASDLQAIFQAIGAAIAVPAATGIQVVDTVDNHFSASGAAASKGVVAQAGNVLTWNIQELGTETATLTYTATHDSTKAGGVERVNASVTYTDTEGNTVNFPNPTINVRGCPAGIDLTPESATNEPPADHTVTATVVDDFGDPVSGISVDFNVVSGPNAGSVGGADTNNAGQASFTYSGTELGTDEIVACFDDNAGTRHCDRATKDWVDETAPIAACEETVNPHGKKIPPAGSTTLPGPKGGQNEDGFYQLIGKDVFDPNPQVFVVDTGSGTVFGPFASGDNIKYTEANGAAPNFKKIGSGNGKAGAVAAHITGKGDAVVFAVDVAGNESKRVSCLVPPPAK